MLLGRSKLFCHVYGRAKSASPFIPGWPYSFAVALETGRSSWTAPLDVVRLGPVDDATAVTAAQLRAVIERLIAAGQWRSGDPDVLIVADAGYNITRLAVALTSRMPLDLHRWNYRQARRYALPLSTVSS
ncbi:transposase [Nonomuraea sp. NPDC050202]|uniref:transposase n=1 Tax=Nonomuraea sp. NPDC050202 TaxID=3155035 RepID=UPI0033CCAFE8